MNWYKKLNNLFHGAYYKSWVGHALFFFGVSLICNFLGLTYFLPIGAMLGQEFTQMDIYGIRFKKGQKGIPWYDYVGDFIADTLGIYLAYSLF